MWFLLVILLLNASLSQLWTNAWRFNLGAGFQIGLWEFVLLYAVVAGVIQGAIYRQRLPEYRVSRLYRVTLTLLITGVFCGLVGDGIYGVADWKGTFTLVREYSGFPIMLFAGYRLWPDLRSISKFNIAMVIGGVLTSIMLFVYFGSGAEHAGEANTINYVRSTSYISAYAGIACLMLVYSLSNSQLKFIPTSVALILAPITLVGSWATLNRGDWLFMMVSFLLLPTYLPAGKRVSTAIRGVLIMPLLIITLLGAVNVGGVAMGRDLGKVISERLLTLLPTQRDEKSEKAWDARWPAAQVELEMWSSNPIFGTGMSAEERYIDSTGVMYWGFNHNGWASLAAKMGLIGLSGSVLVYTGLIFKGRKLLFQTTRPDLAMFAFTASIAGVILLIQIIVTMSWHTRSGILWGMLLGVLCKVDDLHKLELQGLYPEESDAYFDLAYPPPPSTIEPLIA